MATELPLRWLEADRDLSEPDVRCHSLTICDALDSDVAEVHHIESATGPKLTFEEATTYARLFVASPRLLAALKDMVKWHGKRVAEIPSNDDELLPPDQQEPEVAEAMRAIAEATGEQA